MERRKTRTRSFEYHSVRQFTSKSCDKMTRDYSLSVIGVYGMQAFGCIHIEFIGKQAHPFFNCVLRTGPNPFTRETVRYSHLYIRWYRLTHYLAVCTTFASHKRRSVCSTNRWQNTQTTEADTINRMVSKLRIICILDEMMLLYMLSSLLIQFDIHGSPTLAFTNNVQVVGVPLLRFRWWLVGS